MRLNLHRNVLTICVAAAIVGCSSQTVNLNGSVPQSVRNTRNVQSLESWTASRAHAIKRLLYTSDRETNDVYVYDYDTGALVGTLTGFAQASGLCVDGPGNIYVTTLVGGQGEILEYPHGGATPIGKFYTDGDPIGCSIDPVTGNLAVANNIGSQANVQVWKKGSSVPEEFKNENDCYAIWAPPGYDDKGNLFMLTAPTRPGLCELPAGGSTLVGAIFKHFVTNPGSIMWDGKHITLADLNFKGSFTTAIYRAEERHGVLRLVGTTLLRDRGCGSVVPQPFIVGKKNTPANHEQGKVVVGGNADCRGASPVKYWRYPESGPPFKEVHPGSNDVYGVAVSIAE